MLPRFAGSVLLLSSALMLPAFAAHAGEGSSPARIEVAQFFGQRSPEYAQRPPADMDDYGAPAGRADEAGLSVRVDHLEAQLRSMTGQLEQAQFQIRKLQEQLTKFQQDVEFRFQESAHGGRAVPPRRSELEPGPGSIPAPASTASVATPGNAGSIASAGMRRGDAFDPDADPNAPGAPRHLGSIASSATATRPIAAAEPAPLTEGPLESRDPSRPMDLMARAGHAAGSSALPSSGPLVPITESPPVAAPARSQAPAVAAVQPAATTPAGPPRVIPLTPQVPGTTIGVGPAAGTQVAALPQASTPKTEYEEAVGLLKQGQYDAAEKGFSEFVSKNPKSALVPSAVLNLGESYYLRGRHREAAEQFLKISTNYPSSNRAPEAMLRLGQSLNSIGGAKEQACAAFGEVTRKYPKASANVRAAAEREAKKSQC